MTDPSTGVTGLVARFTEMRGNGQAADGLITVTVDGTGGIQDLTIQPKAMRLPSDDLAAAIKLAFDEARLNIQAELKEMPPPSTVPADFRAQLEEMSFQAQRRLDDILSLASDVAANTRRGV